MKKQAASSYNLLSVVFLFSKNADINVNTENSLKY